MVCFTRVSGMSEQLTSVHDTCRADDEKAVFLLRLHIDVRDVGETDERDSGIVAGLLHTVERLVLCFRMYERLSEPVMRVIIHDNGRCIALYHILFYPRYPDCPRFRQGSKNRLFITTGCVSITTTGINI